MLKRLILEGCIMNYLDKLKEQENECNKLWEESYAEYGKDKTVSLNHIHLCDFDILTYRGKWSFRKFEKEKEKWCRKYLKSVGKERDKYLECCGSCIHDKYVTTDFDQNYVLNVATLGLKDRIKS